MFRAAAKSRRHNADRPEALAIFTIVVWGSIIAAVVAICLFVFSSQNFPIRSIAVHGDLRQLHPDVVRAVALPHVQKGFFMSDITAVQLDLMHDPWVRDVEVRRKWPDGISIDIIEERAFARWADDGFLSHSGEFFVLSDIDVLRQELPLMTGPPHSYGKVFTKYIHITGLLQKIGLRVDELHLDKRDSWKMTLDNGWQINLGRQRLEQNLHRLVFIVHDVLAGRAAEVDTIDMRYENGYAVVWKKNTSHSTDLTAKLVD